MKALLIKMIASLLVAMLLITTLGFAEESTLIASADDLIGDTAEPAIESAMESNLEMDYVPSDVEDNTSDITPDAVDETVNEDTADLGNDDPLDLVQDLPSADDDGSSSELLFEPQFEGGLSIVDTFPDLNLQNHLSSIMYDTDGDGYLSQEELEYVLAIAFDDISDFTGIQYLPKLECIGKLSGTIKCLPLSNLPNLKILNLRSCSGLTSIDISKIPSVEELSIEDCGITSLNLSGCSNLKYLRANGNKLSSLDITDCPSLLALVAEETLGTGTNTDGSKHYSYIKATGYEANAYIYYDMTTTLITEKAPPAPEPSPEPSPAPAPAPAAVAAPVATTVTTIAATSKSSKATLVAAPGTTAQLDLAGVTGTNFNSSKKKVATVDQAGTITVKGPGKTKITFKVNKKKRTVNLTIKDPTIPTSVALTVPTPLVKKGDQITLTPIIPDGTNAGGFKWKSSNKRIAKVNAYGTVTFKKNGKVTITCTAKRGKKKAKIKFTVSK